MEFIGAANGSASIGGGIVLVRVSLAWHRKTVKIEVYN